MVALFVVVSSEKRFLATMSVAAIEAWLLKSSNISEDNSLLLCEEVLTRINPQRSQLELLSKLLTFQLQQNLTVSTIQCF